MREVDHIDPVICPSCKYYIDDWQEQCFSCPCGRVFCINCRMELPRERLDESIAYCGG